MLMQVGRHQAVWARTCLTVIDTASHLLTFVIYGPVKQEWALCPVLFHIVKYK